MEGDTGNDKHLSGEEKRAKLREEYKRELMERKRIEEQMKGAGTMGKIQQALDQILNFNDDTEEWINKINEKAAHTEARLDIALEGKGSGTQAPAAKPQQTTGSLADKVAGDTMTEARAADAAVNRIVEKTLGDVAAPGNTPPQTGNTTSNDAPSSKKTLGEEEK